MEAEEYASTDKKPRASRPLSFAEPAEPAWVVRATWFFVGLGIAVRLVRYFVNYPIWHDEAFLAVNFWDRDYLDLLRPLDYGQVARRFLGGTPQLLAVAVLAVSFYPIRHGAEIKPYASDLLAALILLALAV